MCRPLTLPPEIMPVYQKTSILRKLSSLLIFNLTEFAISAIYHLGIGRELKAFRNQNI